MDVSVFVSNVKARCKELNTTPTVACTESGAGRNMITNMKKGSMPSIDRVRMLADYLNCSISDLTGEADPAPASDPELAAALSQFEKLTPEQRAKVIGYMEGLISSR